MRPYVRCLAVALPSSSRIIAGRSQTAKQKKNAREIMIEDYINLIRAAKLIHNFPCELVAAAHESLAIRDVD